LAPSAVPARGHDRFIRAAGASQGSFSRFWFCAQAAAKNMHPDVLLVRQDLHRAQQRLDRHHLHRRADSSRFPDFRPDGGKIERVAREQPPSWASARFVSAIFCSRCFSNS